MSNSNISYDKKQRLRMLRHLIGMFFISIFTLFTIYFYHINLITIEQEDFIFLNVFFWSGLFLITATFYLGLNIRFKDKSLTIPQMLWSTLYVLIVIYILDEWRSLPLMCVFAIFTFGYFKLRFREFLTVALFAVLGYILIILYLFIYEPSRIELELELFQLLTFTGAISVMLYTGSSIHILRDKAKLQNVALQVALEKNQILATTDELTSLYNRRHFMDLLAQQKALFERDGSDFVLCFCDLDNFKQINDTFGHHTGDIVLQKFSEILKSSIREIDFAARFGGEEFVYLLVNTDIENAVKVTERIRKSLESYNFNDIAPSLHATVSIGMANFKQYSTIQETLMSADNRMYQAKKSGRNKVVYTDGNST